MLETIENLLLFTKANSIGGVAVRGIIWLIIVLLLAFGLDKGKKIKNIKADIGWFFLMIFTFAIISLVIFGIFPTF